MRCRRRGEVTHEVVTAFVHSSWHSLDLCGCADLKPTTLVTIISRLPKLQALDLSGCQVTEYVLRFIGRECKNLQVLRLSGYRINEVSLRVWCHIREPSTSDDCPASTTDTWESDHAKPVLSGR